MLGYFIFAPSSFEGYREVQASYCETAPLQAPRKGAARSPASTPSTPQLFLQGRGKGSSGRQPHTLLKPNSFLLNMHELSLLKAWQLCKCGWILTETAKGIALKQKANSLPAFMPLLQSMGVPCSYKEKITRMVFVSFVCIYFIIIFTLLLQNTVPAFPSPSAWFCGIALAEISQPGAANLVQKAHHQNGSTSAKKQAPVNRVSWKCPAYKTHILPQFLRAQITQHTLFFVPVRDTAVCRVNPSNGMETFRGGAGLCQRGKVLCRSVGKGF